MCPYFEYMLAQKTALFYITMFAVIVCSSCTFKGAKISLLYAKMPDVCMKVILRDMGGTNLCCHSHNTGHRGVEIGN